MINVNSLKDKEEYLMIQLPVVLETIKLYGTTKESLFVILNFMLCEFFTEAELPNFADLMKFYFGNREYINETTPCIMNFMENNRGVCFEEFKDVLKKKAEEN
jgi:hypothetical protein